MFTKERRMAHEILHFYLVFDVSCFFLISGKACAGELSTALGSIKIKVTILKKLAD